MVPFRVLAIGMALLAADHAAFAQLLPPNAAGVTAGHEHFLATDVEGAVRFWNALGGETATVGRAPVLRFPGVFVIVAPASEQRPLTGGSRGSAVDRIRFRIRDLGATIRRLEETGYRASPRAGGTTTEVMGPSDAAVQLVEDRALPGPVATDALVMHVPDAAGAAAWYARWFGAAIVRRAGVTYAQIPGMDIEFRETREPRMPTRGRALDHIGFEIRDLQGFVKRTSERGLEFQRRFTIAPPLYNPPVKGLAFLIDPWGTAIELNEGFADAR
jgi:hypothetical protein